MRNKYSLFILLGIVCILLITANISIMNTHNECIYNKDDEIISFIKLEKNDRNNKEIMSSVIRTANKNDPKLQLLRDNYMGDGIWWPIRQLCANDHDVLVAQCVRLDKSTTNWRIAIYNKQGGLICDKMAFDSIRDVTSIDDTFVIVVGEYIVAMDKEDDYKINAMINLYQLFKASTTTVWHVDNTLYVVNEHNGDVYRLCGRKDSLYMKKCYQLNGKYYNGIDRYERIMTSCCDKIVIETKSSIDVYEIETRRRFSISHENLRNRGWRRAIKQIARDESVSYSCSKTSVGLSELSDAIFKEGIVDIVPIPRDNVLVIEYSSDGLFGEEGCYYEYRYADQRCLRTELASGRMPSGSMPFGGVGWSTRYLECGDWIIRGSNAKDGIIYMDSSTHGGLRYKTTNNCDIYRHTAYCHKDKIYYMNKNVLAIIKMIKSDVVEENIVVSE